MDNPSAAAQAGLAQTAAPEARGAPPLPTFQVRLLFTPLYVFKSNYLHLLCTTSVSSSVRSWSPVPRGRGQHRAGCWVLFGAVTLEPRWFISQVTELEGADDTRPRGSGGSHRLRPHRVPEPRRHCAKKESSTTERHPLYSKIDIYGTSPNTLLPRAAAYAPRLTPKSSHIQI